MPLLIDVRTKEEYDEHHAPGAALLPLTAIVCGNLGILAETDKETSIELYCRSGGRSEKARSLLLEAGFTNVINRGGLSDVENGERNQAKAGIVVQTVPYWFRPARFWKWFAFYYPVSRRGWGVTLVLIGVAGLLFSFIDQQSYSVSDTLIAFAPWAIALLAVFDMLCFRHGEYPSWWRKN